MKLTKTAEEWLKNCDRKKHKQQKSVIAIKPIYVQQLL